jgi:demethylmenaquinone methyltransferase/2-methoxy-6-polyprenyl-1,4-benzoquinol methylase
MSTEGILQPHPTLTAYYQSESAKRGFLRQIFDVAAPDYDSVERMLSFGSGRRYRREALDRAGLGSGMKVLDVAVGTGLVAREAVMLTGRADLVFGLDPSAAMIQQAAEPLGIRALIGVAEQIQLASEQFEFLSMGYALRHLADLHRAFSEFFRVLRPGGRLCLLEITAPRSRVWRTLLRAHMRFIVPRVMRVVTGRSISQRLWQYYWETIDACLSPQTVMDALREAGFTHVARQVTLGICSEYTALKSRSTMPCDVQDAAG